MEIKDILKAIKYPVTDDTNLDELTVDNINDYMLKNYIGLEIAHTSEDVISKVLGKERSSNEVALKRILKDFDIKLDENVTWKDGMIDKASELIKEKMNKLKEDASKDNDKKLTELNTTYENLKSDYKLETENHEKTKGELAGEKKKHEDYINNQSLNQKQAIAKSKLIFGDEVNDLTKKGFFAAFNEKYNIELSTEDDSKDGLRIITKEDNKRVNDGKENLTLEALYLQEAKDAGILKLNNKKEPDKKKITTTTTEDNVNKVFQGAIEHAESMK